MEDLLHVIADRKTNLVDPIQVQIVCSNLERNVVIGRKNSIITKRDIPPIDDIINAFYKTSWDLVKIQVSLNEQDFDIKRKQIIGQLVVKESRNMVHYGMLIKSDSRALDEKILEILVSAGLIREIRFGEMDIFYQLCHDRFIKSVNEDILKLQEKTDLKIQLEEKERIEKEVKGNTEELKRAKEKEEKELERGAANASSNPKLNIINKARDIIRGKRNLSIMQLDDMCKELESLDQFAYATEILLIS